MMQAAEREWHKTTDKPLKMIAGPFVLVSSAAFYGADKPSTFANFSSYLSPWATEERLSRDGMAIMCEAESDDPSCLRDMERYTAHAPGARRADVALARHWLWFANAPKRFVIAIVPPRS
jgi:hypothetical protein